MAACRPCPGARRLAAVAAACVLAGSAWGGAAPESDVRAWLAPHAESELPAGPPGGWVDAHRWAAAHARLECGARLDEANRYFSEIRFVSTWRGLVADTDVQMTDLLWTYHRFRNSERLGTAAKSHLERMFADWRVPNPDRNREADTAYEWPADYTENHSLNILAGAYLRDAALERDRAQRADLLLRFFEDRARRGWSEFHSPQYALVTAKALVLLADAAPDEPVRTAARMHLDLLALEFANFGLGLWRAVPFVRGRFGDDLRQDAFHGLARAWFGGTDKVGTAPCDPHLLAAVTCHYRPPAAAARLLADLAGRGCFEMRQTMTTGSARTRVPIVVWVSPSVTLASAQGWGSYYQGGYWAAAFASAPDRLLTGEYGRGRNLCQVRNVLAVFGGVHWRGAFEKQTDGPLTIGGDGQAWIGQLDLAPDCRLLMAGDKTGYPDMAAFRAAFERLSGSFSNGVVSWLMPDGTRVQMVNSRCGDRWRMERLLINGEQTDPDSGMLFDSPFLRSRSGSGLVEALDGNKKLVYDFRDRYRPCVREEPGAAFPPLPARRLSGPLGIRFVYVPPGEFPMGSHAAEGRADERPMRWVDLDGFYISETEVTVGQYKAYLKALPDAAAMPDWYWTEWGKTDQHPITFVSWHDAEAFCRWLSSLGQGVFALPTEAQWEKAARGFGYRVYPWGNEYDGSQSGNPNGVYMPAGSHPLDLSPFGARDMAGNAWEWCADWHSPDAYAAESARNPTGPASGSARVLRGCGWNFDPDTFRCAYRSRLPPAERSVHIGFRIVRRSE